MCELRLRNEPDVADAGAGTSPYYEIIFFSGLRLLLSNAGTSNVLVNNCSLVI